MAEMTEVQRTVVVLQSETRVMNIAQFDPFVLLHGLVVLCALFWENKTNEMNPDQSSSRFTSILFNVIKKVKFKVYQPHHVAFFILYFLTNLTSNILKIASLNTFIVDSKLLT